MQPSEQGFFAILGHPVSHSLSPFLHGKAFELLGLPYRYVAVDVEPSELPRKVAELVRDGCLGFNVTLPNKESIIPLLSEVDDTARAIGAVNTLIVRSGRLVGYNTDCDGVRVSLQPFRARIEKQEVLLLGAGGAARAVAYALQASYSVGMIHIAVRSVDRGRRFISSLNLHRSDVLEMGDPKISAAAASSALVVNATPVGMIPHAGESPLPAGGTFRRGQIVFDLIYRPPETRLIRDARLAGAEVVTGVTMFLHQAAKAFQLWTGKEMPLTEMGKALEQKLTDERHG
ncbi:MAG TPA: shikimate dehydrogenase [Bacteroidota bacterium]|nr:shikimate dehydrogenase [Bacteroidota bacterium]